MLQIFIGFTVLIIGALVYLIDRHPDQTYFIQIIGLSLHDILPNIFGHFGNNLPAFIHVFSFILITSGLLTYTYHSKKNYLFVCLLWATVDIFFELLQKYKKFALKIIPYSFQHIPILNNTKNFIQNGTFDYFDILYIIIGSVLAYLVLLITNKGIQNEI